MTGINAEIGDGRTVAGKLGTDLQKALGYMITHAPELPPSTVTAVLGVAGISEERIGIDSPVSAEVSPKE